jgi:hypothetical protein
LDNVPGVYLCQANMFTDGADLRIQEFEDLSLEERGWFEARIVNTNRLMRSRGHASANPGDIESLFEMITSQAGGKWAYANQHVKAYFICQLTPSCAEIWVGVGPAMDSDQPTVLIIQTNPS